MVDGEAKTGGGGVPGRAQRRPAECRLREALALLEGPHPGGEDVADRDFFEDTADWRWRWKEIFDLAYFLYALPREGGTVALGSSRRFAAM